MAKKIIQAQMQQRRDTKANWASKNPVLLAGELGIVSDDPNLYKVGDGTSEWNSLPFRGFNGTLVHTTGDSETAAMSQKGVTEELAKLSAEMSAISGGVTLNKSMYSNGVEKADVGFYITPFIPVTSSDKISVVISPSLTSKCLVLYDSSYQVIDYLGLYSDRQISLSTYSKSAYVRTIFKMGEGGSMSINGTLVWDNSSFEFPSFAISTDLIQTWILADLYIPSNIIRGVDGNVKSCDVTWCDGVKGNMNISRDSRGNVMSVTATYNGKTYVLTIARDSEGNVTSTNIQ